MVAPKHSSRGGRARSHGTRGSAGAYLDREARPGAEKHVAAPELNSTRRRGLGPRATWQHRSSPKQGGEVRGRGTRGGSGAHLCREVWSEGTTCVVARGCTPCSLSWLRACMREYPVFRVPTKAHLGRGCELVGGANFSASHSVILSFYSAVDGAPTINVKTSTAGPREVPELKARERPPPTWKRRRWAPGGAEAEGPGAPTINVKTSTAGPREVPELEIRECPPSM
jgi:hypothetical protein